MSPLAEALISAGAALVAAAAWAVVLALVVA